MDEEMVDDDTDIADMKVGYYLLIDCVFSINLPATA